MPYHVEIRRARRHARVFNLTEKELQRTVIDPWRRGRPLELGERRWERADAQLRILDGPALEGVDLAYGQGWNRAERTARDVTDELLAGGASVVAVLACTHEAEDAVTALLAAVGVDAVAWRAAARRPILDWLTAGGRSEPLDFAAAIVVGDPDPPDWWFFEAGVALGALGSRAVLVALDGEPPPPVLDELEVLRLESDGVAGERDSALAKRLRAIGIRPAPPEARRAS
jgi:hypothetical protein